MVVKVNKFNLSGKTALVTGGSKGIGRAITIILAEAGAKVFFTYRNNDQNIKGLKAIADKLSLKIEGFQSDATNLEDCQKLVSIIEERGGRLHCLVNNVGDVISRTSFEESEIKLWEECININLMTAVRVTKLLLPFLKKTGGASIINVSSIAGQTGGSGDSLHYGVTKSALNTFTMGLAREMKQNGIRVNAIAPSIIDTDFQKKHSTAKRLKKIIEQTPVGRIGTPDEVANCVLFLASEAASYVSGEIMVISGGR